MEQILKKMVKDKIRFDCRHYSGYKPCGYAEFCSDCDHFESIKERILIIKLGALGDVLRTTCILPGIKKKYPLSHITWITESNGIPLLKDNPYIDSLWIFDAAGVLTVCSHTFDIAMNFEKVEPALALMDAANARKKRGFAFSGAKTLFVANEASLYALQLGLNDELKFRHNKKTYQEIIYEMAEIPYNGEGYVLHLSEKAQEFSRHARKRFGIKPEKPTIGLNTGCGGVFETKRWTRQGFCELAQKLASEKNCNLLLLGGKREIDFNNAILDKCSAPLIDTGCHNTLEEFLGIMQICDVVVSSDSLAMHIALALEKQVVVFFGSTCPQEVNLFGRGEKIITDFTCSPCYKKQCDMSPSCMDELNAQTVFEAVCRRLNALSSIRK